MAEKFREGRIKSCGFKSKPSSPRPEPKAQRPQKAVVGIEKILVELQITVKVKDIKFRKMDKEKKGGK